MAPALPPEIPSSSTHTAGGCRTAPRRCPARRALVRLAAGGFVCLAALGCACLATGAKTWPVAPQRAIASPPTGTSSETSGAAAAAGVSAAQEAYDQALVDLLMLEQRLHSAQVRLAEAQDESARLEEELLAAEAAEERAGQDLALVEERRSERLRGIYMSRSTGWLEVLAESSDLTQFLKRMFLLERVVDQESELSRAVEDALAEAAEAAEALAGARDRQGAAVVELRGVEAELEDARAAQEAVAARLGDRLEEARREAGVARQRMAELNREAAQSPSPSGGQPSDSDTDGGSRAGSVSPAAPPTTRPPESASGGAPPTGRQLTVKCTAYALPGTTATGVPVRYGIVAVDPRVIPLGTRLWIPGYGEGLAADTGGAVKGNKIDVWLPSRREALDWGIKTMTITILD